MTIKKEYAYWAVAMVLQILLITYLQGWFTTQTSDLKMSPVEARLVRSAIALVREDVAEGNITNTSQALSAFSAALPSSVRDKVLEAFGKPDIRDFQEALDALEGHLL